MPTGYTHRLIEEKQSFPHFALSCARAFGAFIHMRDDDMDAPLKPAVVGTYHLDARNEAQAKLATLLKTPAAQFRAAQKRDRLTRASHMADIRKTYTEENALLEAMELKVCAWTPPTPEHQGLKTFMLDQIKISKHDLSPRDAEDASRPFITKAQAIADLRETIAYHEKGHAEAVATAKRSNDWASALKESL